MSNNPVFDERMNAFRRQLESERAGLVAELQPLVVRLLMTAEVVDGIQPKQYRIDSAFTKDHGPIFSAAEHELNRIKHEFWAEQRKVN